MNSSRKLVLLLAGICLVTAAPPARAQWVTTYEQFYLPGDFNWKFRHNYPAADKLFNAFDYGHAILYERLWTQPGADVSILEDKEYNFITRELLVHPPKVPLEEGAIEIAYAKLAPEAKTMFDWAHLLHRQIYDVWADETIPTGEKDKRVQELIRYYKTRPDLAFSSRPKTMELMEGQPYSLAFRKNYPKFNGLIWAYHWLQVGLYEPLVTGKTLDERQTGVIAAVARFKQMLENAPKDMPRIMPMTAAVAPTFAARYPEAAIIFDNLHSMHDVVSDILANPSVPRNQKRARIMEAARRYRDNTSYVQSVEEWKSMAQMMGVENMGGPATGFLTGLPAGTVERGAVMAGMDHSRMKMPQGNLRDSAMAGMDHSGMDHSKMNMPAPATKDTAMGGMDHSNMAAPGMQESSDAMMEMHMQMMADPVIRARMMADPKLRSMMAAMLESMPAEHREMMKKMMAVERPSAAKRNPPKKVGVKKPAAKKSSGKQAPKPGVKKVDPMAGMDHSKMKMK